MQVVVNTLQINVALAYPCRKKIIPNHAIKRQTSVSARYGRKKDKYS